MAQVVGVNLTGVFLCCRTVVPVMTAMTNSLGRRWLRHRLAGLEGNSFTTGAVFAPSGGPATLFTPLRPDVQKHAEKVACPEIRPYT